MNVVQVLNVKLQRNDQNVSWGFNVQGGKEFNCPLVIQRVTANSLADRCSIRPGDYILRVGTLSTEHLTHNQSRDSIVRQGNSLELTLQRGAPPRPEDYHAKLDFPQHQLMTPENVEPKATLSPQVGVQLSKNKALLTQSYNSPMGLYSSQNIADTLVSSIKNSSRSSSNDPDTLSTSSSPTNLSSLSTSSSLLNPSDLDLITNSNCNNPLPIKSVPTKSDLINRLSLTLLKTKHTVKEGSNDFDLIRNSANNFSAYRNSFKYEINRINNENKNNNINNNNNNNSSNSSDNNTILTRRRVSNISILRSNFESNQNNSTNTLPIQFQTRPKSAIQGFNNQSRSFKLLQETLENGLVVNDTVIHDNLTNKSHRRRCSLATPVINPSTCSFSSEQNQSKTTLSNDQKKLYIRKLSLANDESAEPKFLFKSAVLKAIGEKTNNQNTD